MVEEVICVIGINGAGKSTTAQRLKKQFEQLDKKVVIESFAKPLKNIASEHLGYSEEKKNSGQRKILEELAATIRKELGDSVFSYAMLDRIVEQDAEIVIIDDMRFMPEIKMLQEFTSLNVVVLPFVSFCPDEYDQLAYSRVITMLKYLDGTAFEYHTLSNTSDDALREFICNLYGDILA